MTAKEYKQSNAMSLSNSPQFQEWESSLAPIQRIFLRKDNRIAMEKAFGKPNFHFVCGYRLHGWTIQFNNRTYIVLTGARKGTCLETLNHDFQNPNPEYVEFGKWLIKQLYNNYYHKLDNPISTFLTNLSLTT